MTGPRGLWPAEPAGWIGGVFALVAVGCGPTEAPSGSLERKVVVHVDAAAIAPEALGLTSDQPVFIGLGLRAGDKDLGSYALSLGETVLTLPAAGRVDARASLFTFRADAPDALYHSVALGSADLSPTTASDAAELTLTFEPYTKNRLVNVYGLLHESSSRPAEGAKVSIVDPISGATIRAPGLEFLAQTDSNGAYAFAFPMGLPFAGDRIRLEIEHNGTTTRRELSLADSGLPGYTLPGLNLAADGNIQPTFLNLNDFDNDGTPNDVEIATGTNPFSQLSGAKGDKGDQGDPGLSIAQLATVIAPGTICPLGGMSFQSFTDTNRNGARDTGESLMGSAVVSCYPAPPAPAPRNQLLANNIVIGRWLGESAQNILETLSGHRVLLQPGTTSGTFAPVRTEIFYPLVQCQGEPFSYAMAIGQAVYPLSGDRPFATKDGRLLGRTQARSVLMPTGCSNIEHWEALNPQAMAPTIDSASSVRAGDRLFFQASNGLWITNGSPQGTVLLRQFSSSPNAFMVHNSVVYFVAATEAGSMALWSSDGTVSGTKMVSDVNSGSPNSWFWVTSIVNGRAILANNSGPTKVLLSVALIGGAVTTLHTATTTCEYGSFYGESAVAGSTLYVVFNEHDANCVLTNQSILSTDGTTTSTRVAVDLVPNSEIENYNYLSALGTSLIFRANNGTSGDELWSFNGTSTVLLKDINVGSGGSNPLPLFTLGSALFFSAQDASGATAIYRTDGTSNGTALFRSFPAGGNNDWVDIQHFKASSTLAYVAARRSGSAPFGEFWRTDGTTANTVALTPWPVEASASLWNAVTDTSGNFYFPGFTTAHGQELFRISGTTISLVADIAPGAGSFSPTSLALGLDGRVYFSSTNNGSGSQNGGDLWSTNGTASGTRRVLGRVLEDGLGIQDRIIPLPGGLVFKAKRPDMGTERVLLTYRPGILNTFPSEGMTAVLPLSAPLIAPGGMLTLVP